MELQPDVVFNLVESLGGTDRLMPLATMLLDALQIPHTGARTDAILATSNKLTAKERLCEAGLPTPAWLQASASRNVDSRSELVNNRRIGFQPVTKPARRKPVAPFRSDEESLNHGANHDDRWILKPVLEHASFGIDDDAVVTEDDVSALEARVRARERRLERPHFAEQFIDGREFNLSLLGENRRQFQHAPSK